MRRPQANSPYARNAGAALLIAIFALLLISVVAIAMIVSTGTDSALAGNYRTASGAYYASVAGLEEARGRLLFKNPNFINQGGSYTNVLFDSTGTLPAWGLTNVVYIINPAPGETVDPALLSGPNPTAYPDTEYGNEFSWGLSGANVLPYVISASSASGLSPGPSYKWVRINAVSEQSLKIDVNGNSTLDPYVVYYDPAHVNPGAPNTPAPSLVTSSSGFPASTTPPSPPPTPTSVQALEVTALAVLPGGGTRLLQYLVAPVMISPDVGDMAFPGALTLDGNGVNFLAPTSATSFQMNGVDTPPSPWPLPCSPAPVPAMASIAYTNSADYNPLFNQVNPYKASYPGAMLVPPANTPTTPSLSNIALRQSWLTPISLDAVVQDITNSADIIIQGPATGADLLNKAPGTSPSNPMTIVVNGDFNFTRNTSTGYGLLLVTGNMTYDPDASWVGIVMVVGQGSFTINKGGSGGFTGAFFVAKTRDSAGNLLPTLGAASFNVINNRPGSGVLYSSCAIRAAQGPLTYKVLSFHEIPTT
jgi:hypothetical protein